MDRKQFMDRLNRNLDKALSIIEKKNHDYASSIDPFGNFRNCELAGYRIQDGIYIRLLDKVARIGNYLRFNKIAVETESVEDTLLDLINYANILLTYTQGEREEFDRKMYDEAEKLKEVSTEIAKKEINRTLDIGGIPKRHSARLALEESIRNLNS